MKLIILDRDGVINEDSDDYIRSLADFRLLPGALEAIVRLNHHGYRVAVATNQSGIARGYFTFSTLNEMHAQLQGQLAPLGGVIDLFAICPHGPDEGCSCRKPAPGLLLQIAERYGLSLVNVPVIGDSLRDLQAAAAVGAQPILVLTGKGQRTLRGNPDLSQDYPVYPTLLHAVEALIMRGN
jgi:D-glycero-D-manno-heptose 1,7-bisphosphate phosphatase